MKHFNFQRSIVYVAVILFSLTLTTLTRPHQALSPQVAVLPLTPAGIKWQTPRIKLAELQVLSQVPYGAIALARINMKYHVPKPNAAAKARMIKQAKQIALKLGANAIAIAGPVYSGLQEGNAQLSENYMLEAMALTLPGGAS